MIKVGCAGYPIGRDRYWRTLSFVEGDTGKGLPRPETLANWKADVPPGGEASLQALRAITHGPEDKGFPPAYKKLDGRRRAMCGGFRESLEVYEAWMATRSAAESLGAKIVVFESPQSFSAGPDRLRDLYNFFKKAVRGKLIFVWQPPRTNEWDILADRVCQDVGVIRAFDPLRQPPPKKGAFLYMRPRVPGLATLTVDNVATIRRAAADVPAYLVLSHRRSFPDAERLRMNR